MTGSVSSIDISRVSLPNHPTLRKLPMGGLGAMLFGLPFVGAGVMICLAAANIIGKPSAKHAPDWVLYCIGGIFGGAGLYMLLGGAWSWFRQVKRSSMQTRRPDAPWLWDYKWNQRGATWLGLGRLFSGLMFSLFCGTFFAVFYGTFWKARSKTGHIDFFLWFFFGFLGLMVGIGIIWTLYCLLRMLKYGRGFLGFAHFPFRVGETINLNFKIPRALKNFTTIDFHLQLVEEVIEVSRRSDGRSSSLLAYRLYRETQQVESAQVPSGQKILTVNFALPPDQPGNLLAESPCRYWQLQVESETPGIDYKAYFILPVYGP